MAGKPFEKALKAIQRWFRAKRDPQDPYARVRAPIKKGPGGRSAAVALEEPD